MEELLIVNPSGRKRRKRGKKSSRRKGRRRSAAQRAATRKMLAANRRKGRKSGVIHMAKRRSRRKGRKGRRRGRRRNPVGMYLRNPRLRLGRVGGRDVMPMVQNAFTGALGAVAMTSVLSRLPLPAMLMTGKVRYITQGAVAIGLGMLAQMVGLKGALAAKAAEGALTVTLNDMVKEVAMDAGINLGGLGYYLPGVGVRAVPSASGRPSPQLGRLGRYVSGPGSGVPSSAPGSVVPIRRGFGNVRSFGF